MCGIGTSHHIPSYLVALIILDESYKLPSSSLCIFPILCYFMCPRSKCLAQHSCFPNTFNLCYPFEWETKFRAHINTTNEILIFYNLFHSLATGWTIGVLGFDFRRGLWNFLFTTASRTALGPIQLPIQRVPGALCLGIRRPGYEADHSPPPSAEVKECVELYFHSTIRFHGVVLTLT
jgi:hypothetical protein